MMTTLALAALLQTDEQGRLHPFIARALASPHALRSSFFLSEDGRVVRSSVRVKREGIPDWVHAMADEKIGQGEDLDYELEVYPDGSEVYEVARKVDGKERQLSAKADRTVYYIGVEIDNDGLPPAVAATLAKLEGFAMKRGVSKEGATFHEVHVEGTLDGRDVRARIAKDGTLIALLKRVPAELEVESSPLKGAHPVF